jgi:hypothetical protein
MGSFEALAAAPRRRCCAATLQLAASSVAFVAVGYERSLRPCDLGVSRASTTIRDGDDL